MKTSWYKEPWAWLVFMLPLSAVIASFTTYYIANHNPDTLVVGDYYKHGQAINQDISKVKLAQKLGMKFNLSMTDDQIVITPTGIDKKFPLLNVYFYHPTLANKDFRLKLTQDADGNFRSALTKAISGKWRITLTPFDEQWKVQEVIHLPSNGAIALTPDITDAN